MVPTKHSGLQLVFCSGLRTDLKRGKHKWGHKNDTTQEGSPELERDYNLFSETAPTLVQSVYGLTTHGNVWSGSWAGRAYFPSGYVLQAPVDSGHSDVWSTWGHLFLRTTYFWNLRWSSQFCVLEDFNGWRSEGVIELLPQPVYCRHWFPVGCSPGQITLAEVHRGLCWETCITPRTSQLGRDIAGGYHKWGS